MKTLISVAAVLAAVGMVAGCFTSATAYTEKTNPDGTKTVSRVSVIGTGDKASKVAAEGLFADGAADDLGAGVKTASASQTSTGIDGTLKGVGDLLGGIASIMQAYPAAGAVPEVQAASVDVDTDVSVSIMYSTDGYGATPAEDGSGVYGRPSCSRCKAYKLAHDTEFVNIDTSSNRLAMWAALRARGYAGSSVALPVVIGATGFTQAAQ